MKSTTVTTLAALTIGLGIAGTGAWVYWQSFATFPDPVAVRIQEAGLDLKRHEVRLLGVPETPTVMTNALSHDGREAEVSCVTCHTTRTPRLENGETPDLELFHQGLAVSHGGLSCLSCHNAEDYNTLRRADGSAVTFPQTMQLCAQCHGPQYRDYQNGSHGGMAGYWDLTRGPRERNSCTVCHDAHAPAYLMLTPVFPPRDGGATPLNHE